VLRPQHEQLASADAGAWSHAYIFDPGEGEAGEAHCALSQPGCPVVRALLTEVIEATGLVVESASFSQIEAGTHIRPHCAPHNGRLKIHVGLEVPVWGRDAGVEKEGRGMAEIVVGREPPRSWTEGSALIFDDSFEHEVRHHGPPGAPPRVILEVTIDTVRSRVKELLRDPWNESAPAAAAEL
jgi:aspartate beta-hydroxylase